MQYHVHTTQDTLYNIVFSGLYGLKALKYFRINHGDQRVFLI